jgi:hypothetical protein
LGAINSEWIFAIGSLAANFKPLLFEERPEHGANIAVVIDHQNCG